MGFQVVSFGFSFVPVLLLILTPTSPLEDALSSILEAYRDEVSSLRASPPSDSERASFHLQWQGRLLLGARENSSSPYYLTALTKALGLSNSLGDYRTSVEIAKELEMASENRSEKAEWLGEQGEILRQHFVQTGSRSSLDEAVVAFKSSVADSDLLDSHPVRFGVHSCMLAEILKDEAGAEAIEILEPVLQKMLGDEKVATDLRIAGFGLERFIGVKLAVACVSGDEKVIRQTLTQLHDVSEMSQLKQEFWIYVDQSARKASSGNPLRMLEILEPWKDHSPFLLASAASCAYDLSNHEKSVGYYSRLRDDFKGELLGEDAVALVAQRGGYYAEVLFNLCSSYVHVGATEKAKDVLSEAEQMFAKDPRLPWSREMIRTAMASSAKTRKDIPRPKRMTGVLTVSALFFAVFLIFVFRRFSSSAQ